MTEERLEQLVEGAAGRFDRSMNRAWEHRPVRLMGGALSLLTGGATLSPPPGGPAGRCTGGSGGC